MYPLLGSYFAEWGASLRPQGDTWEQEGGKWWKCVWLCGQGKAVDVGVSLSSNSMVTTSNKRESNHREFYALSFRTVYVVFWLYHMRGGEWG